MSRVYRANGVRVVIGGRDLAPHVVELELEGEPEWSWYVVRDVPEEGGDGTFYSGDLDELWVDDPRRAAVMTRPAAEQAIEDCDASKLLRHRLRVLPAWHFGCVPGGRS